MRTLVIVRQTHAHAERRDRMLRNACAAGNLDWMSQILDAYFIDGDAADVGTTLYVLHGGLATLDSRHQASGLCSPRCERPEGTTLGPPEPPPRRTHPHALSHPRWPRHARSYRAVVSTW